MISTVVPLIVMDDLPGNQIGRIVQDACVHRQMLSILVQNPIEHHEKVRCHRAQFPRFVQNVQIRYESMEIGESRERKLERILQEVYLRPDRN